MRYGFTCFTHGVYRDYASRSERDAVAITHGQCATRLWATSVKPT